MCEMAVVFTEIQWIASVIRLFKGDDIMRSDNVNVFDRGTYIACKFMQIFDGYKCIRETSNRWSL